MLVTISTCLLIFTGLSKYLINISLNTQLTEPDNEINNWCKLFEYNEDILALKYLVIPNHYKNTIVFYTFLNFKLQNLYFFNKDILIYF